MARYTLTDVASLITAFDGDYDDGIEARIDAFELEGVVEVELTDPATGAVEAFTVTITRKED